MRTEVTATETVSGLNNWKLKLRREADGVTVLRAVTCDTEAALPETLLGLPVTRLAERCLAPDAREPEGDWEALRICGGPETGDWNNRRIRLLSLPRSLRHIDSYAMMNLRALEELRFYDGLLSAGSCTFMNCRWATEKCVCGTARRLFASFESPPFTIRPRMSTHL